jgi:hypothetical protein
MVSRHRVLYFPQRRHAINHSSPVRFFLMRRSRRSPSTRRSSSDQPRRTHPLEHRHVAAILSEPPRRARSPSFLVSRCTPNPNRFVQAHLGSLPDHCVILPSLEHRRFTGELPLLIATSVQCVLVRAVLPSGCAPHIGNARGED